MKFLQHQSENLIDINDITCETVFPRLKRYFDFNLLSRRHCDGQVVTIAGLETFEQGICLKFAADLSTCDLICRVFVSDGILLDGETEFNVVQSCGGAWADEELADFGAVQGVNGIDAFCGDITNLVRKLGFLEDFAGFGKEPSRDSSCDLTPGTRRI